MNTRTPDKGSALVTVLILTVAMGLMAGALVAYAMHERRLNRRELVNIQAQNAARAVLEYATAQIGVQFLNMGRQSELMASYIQGAPFTLYKDSTYGANALFAAGSHTNNFLLNGTNCKLWCSQPTTSGNFTVNRYDPRNANDPFLSVTDPSTVVSAQNIYLLAQATATDPGGVSVTDYAMQVVQMRYLSIFNFSIFYNVTMEFAPGANMTIYGPVFSNQPAYITTDFNLTFTNTFATASTFAAAPLGYNISGSGESGRPVGRNVSFTNGAGTATSINNPTIGGTALGGWVDSFLNAPGSTGYEHTSTNLTSESFAAASTALWGAGTVQSGVQPINLPGVPSTGTQLIIQPPDPVKSPATGDSTFNTGESEKISNLAGLYIVVTPNNSTSATSGSTVVGFYGSPGQVNTSVRNYLYDLTKSPPVKNTPTQRQTWLAANTSSVLFSDNANSGITPSGTNPGANTLAGIVNPTRLFYDPREKQPVNAVDIDVGALASAISNSTLATSNPLTQTGTHGTAWNISDTSHGWNGTVYVDVETDTYGAYAASTVAGGGTPVSASAYYSGWGGTGWNTTSDVTSGGTAITATGTETAVRLVNGGTLPSAGTSPGFSIATNAPVYVVGNYNSDGSLTGGATPTDAQVMTPDGNEVPAMVVGDSINILSKAWWNSTTKQPSGDATLTTATGTSTGNDVSAAANTEIAAAFIGGNVATVTGTYNYSGGVENYMRLEENWSGQILRYRGAIVALYNSAVATGKWNGTGTKTYSAPTRQWGYDNEFGVNHKYPPGSPLIPSIRRYNYTDVNAATFNTMLATAAYGWTAQ